ncbi:hypothetical protein ACGFZJ_11135 [Streptomyces sp. NPDC048253]|uniref:hypothetical protein n=1 Tax=Streptomyces sp. NPDC048253 TaxID=3365524 RepID=UPI0037130FB7
MRHVQPAKFIPPFFSDSVEQALGDLETHQLLEAALYALSLDLSPRDAEELRLALEYVVRVDHKAELIIDGGFRREVPSEVAPDKRELVRQAIARAFWVRAELRRLDVTP